MTMRMLRWTAIAIAAAALIDPSVTVARRGRARLSIVVEDHAPRDEVARRRRELVAALAHDFEIVDGLDRTSAHTIVIGDRYPDQSISGRASTVTLSGVVAGPRLMTIDAPRAVPAATAVHLAIDVDHAGGGAAASSIAITSSGVEVGRATHTWAGRANRWRAEVDVVPVGAAPFRFHVALSSTPNQPGDAADVVVDERGDPLRVLVYEARPSWIGTFVRRALESDARFRVSAVGVVSRGIAVKAGEPPPLTAPALADFAAIVVGGIDRLTGADAAALDRFMRERGGAVALIPDSPDDLKGAPVRVLTGDLQPRETLLERHAALTTKPPLPRLDGSEILALTPRDEGQTLARMTGAGGAGAPVVITMPRGDGELLVSGALDAWRFRAEPGVEFDAFWRSAIAGLALAAPADIDLDVSPSLVAPGETAHVTARVRRPLAGGAIAGAIVNGDQIRLWPGAMPGALTGRFTAPPTAGAHAIRVAIDAPVPHSATRAFVVGRGERAEVPSPVPLRLLAASRGGIDVGPGDLHRLERFLRESVDADATREAQHPMRSIWWLAPFALCLSGEWWLRRRRGLL